MAQKKIDALLVGKNILSLLWGLELSSRGRSCVILDDQRVSYGDMFIDSICLFERMFLQKWGEAKNIAPLIRIDRYFERRPLNIVIDNTWIRIGDDAANNIRELIRKVPLFSKVWVLEQRALIGDYDNLCERIAVILLNAKHPEKIDPNQLFEALPTSMRKSFDRFVELAQQKKWQDPQWKIFGTLLYVLGAFFQGKLSYSFSKLELFHLFLCLQSPQYFLNVKKLEQDIVKSFAYPNDKFISGELLNINFVDHRPWMVELSSFKGAVKAQDVVFFGRIPNATELELFPDPDAYCSIQIAMKLKNNYTESAKKERFLFSTPDFVGTDRPMWEVTIDGPNILFHVFIKALEGRKVSFIGEDLWKRLAPEILRIIPCTEADLKNPSMQFGPELWASSKEDFITKTIFPKDLAVVKNEVGGKSAYVKGVYYFGPMKASPLGLMSTFIDMKVMTDIIGN